MTPFPRQEILGCVTGKMLWHACIHCSHRTVTHDFRLDFPSVTGCNPSPLSLVSLLSQPQEKQQRPALETTAAITVPGSGWHGQVPKPTHLCTHEVRLFHPPSKPRWQVFPRLLNEEAEAQAGCHLHSNWDGNKAKRQREVAKNKSSRRLARMNS